MPGSDRVDTPTAASASAPASAPCLLGVSSEPPVLCRPKSLQRAWSASKGHGSRIPRVSSLLAWQYLAGYVAGDKASSPYDLMPSSPPSSEQQAATPSQLPNRPRYVFPLLVAPCTRALAPATPCTRNNRIRRTKNLTCCGGGLESNAGRNSQTVDQPSCQVKCFETPPRNHIPQTACSKLPTRERTWLSTSSKKLHSWSGSGL